MNSESKISPTIIRMVLVLVMAAGIGGVYHLSTSGGGGGVDLFTEDLAAEGIDPAAFIPEAAAAVADGPANLALDEGDSPTQAVEFGNEGGGAVLPAAPDSLALIEGNEATIGNDLIEGPVEDALLTSDAVATEGADQPFVSPGGDTTDRVVATSPAATFGTVGTATNRTTPTATINTGTGIFGPGVGFSPAPAQTATRTTTTFGATGNTTAATQTPITNTQQTTTTPAAVPQATTPQANTPQATTTPVVVQQNTTAAAVGQQDATPPVTTPVVPAAPVGPWCQVEVRQTDGVIRWADDGRTTVIRRNDAWFHTPDENAQAILIPETVNTDDQYVLRLWGGGTTDIICSYVSAANAQPAPVAIANATPAAPEVATVAALPTPIGIPGGPVQMGFSADLWAQDRTDYWNELDAVPGSGRLIAHEFKSFTKDIKTDVYRWHLESGRDLLLTWNGTDAETILNGSHDDWIREHARELRSLPGDVMLRFWHEPDVSHKRAWIDNDPQQFIDSWIYVRQIFAEENALNIEWVWCPTAWNWNEQGARYYPGDANVDWICSDGYTGWDLDAPLTDIADAYTDFQAWADQRPHKPILIAEFGAGQRGPGDRAEWVRSIPEWVSASPSIRAVVYFDVDRRPHGEIYDWRLRTEPDAWVQMKDVLSSAPFGR